MACPHEGKTATIWVKCPVCKVVFLTFQIDEPFQTMICHNPFKPCHGKVVWEVADDRPEWIKKFNETLKLLGVDPAPEPVRLFDFGVEWQEDMIVSASIFVRG
jgi:hypothetical protein